MALLTRAEVEDFLYHEAALLDEWKTLEWSALFTEDGEYLVPPTDLPDADKNEALFIINDDHHRLVQRQAPDPTYRARRVPALQNAAYHPQRAHPRAGRARPDGGQ
ncbi:MAG: hypothetical protein Kow0073_04500 [Immundisolibacter sp.]